MAKIYCDQRNSYFESCAFKLQYSYYKGFKQILKKLRKKKLRKNDPVQDEYIVLRAGREKVSDPCQRVSFPQHKEDGGGKTQWPHTAICIQSVPSV